MGDTFTKAADCARDLGSAAQSLIDADPRVFNEANNANQKPDLLCACNGKACDGICRAESGHFKGGDAASGGCTAAYYPLKPRTVRHSR